MAYSLDRDEALEGVTLDTNGHFGRTGVVSSADMGSWLRRELSQSLLLVRMASWMKEVPEERRVRTDDLGGLACHVCGRRDLRPDCTDGDRAYAIAVPCEFPGGMPVYDVIIAVPSGRIAFANDMRRLCPVDAPKGQDERSELHMRRQVEGYARGGMAHIFVGNTCPSVWRVSPTELRVANYLGPEDFEDDPEDMPDGPVTPVAERGQEAGSICTDLWWFSAMDADLHAERCRAIGEDPAGWVDFHVEVEPGNYAFTVERVARDTATEIFSVATRTDRPAGPIVLRDTTVAATLRESQAWREIRSMDRYFDGFGALEYLFMSGGNGYRWRNGLLVDGDGMESEPFRMLADEDEGNGMPDPGEHPLAAAVEPWPDFSLGFDLLASGPGSGSGGIRTLHVSLRYSAAGRVPGEADPWWLAGLVMYLRSALETPGLFVDDRHGTAEGRRRAVARLLHNALDVVEARGGMAFAKPYLDGWRAARPELTKADRP